MARSHRGGAGRGGEADRLTSQELSADGRACRLYDGNWMPMLGLGVWQIRDGRACEDAVRWALEAGYRHIDTAQAYGNEESVGRALRGGGIAREEIFVTTKFAPAADDPAAELERSLNRLGLDYVDLYLVHWPAGGPTRAWPGMQRAAQAGRARSIGVSNFSSDELRTLLKSAEIAPAINQVQFSPYEHRTRLREACLQAGVALEAYSPLGHGRHLSENAVGSIAQRLERTPAQVLLRWCIEQPVPVLAKSEHRSRIEENADIFDFQLSDRDRDELAALDGTSGTDRALERKWW
jgi:diketogulonate reductase-like aldo/keto reductase